MAFSSTSWRSARNPRAAVTRRPGRLLAARRCSCLLLALLLESAARGALAAEQQHVTLQLKWWHQFQFAGYYAARAKGYYAEEGLDVDIRPGSAENPPLSTVLSGAAEYGVTGSDALEARLRGEPVVLLAVIFQHSPYVLLTLRDRHIARPSDLVGRTIMLSDDQGATEFRAMLLAEGLSGGDVHIVPHTWNNEDLISGRADAMSAYSSVEPFQIRSRGTEVSILRPVDYGIDFYGDSLFTTEMEVSAHPERAEGMRRASLRGWEYALTHVDEMIAAILAIPGVRERGVTADGLRFEADAMQELILPNLIELGHSNPGRWQRMADTYVELGLARPGFTLDGFVFESPHFDRRDLRLALGVIAVLAALGGLVLLWNYQLRREVRRRTAALALSERQQRHQHDVLQSVLNNMGDGVIVADAAGTVSMVNPAAEALVGRPSLGDGDPEARPQNYGLYQADGHTLFRPEDLPLMRACRGEACDSVEVQIRNPRRGTLIVHATSRPIRRADGETEGAVVVMRDVSESERTAAAIRSMNTLLESRVRERTAQLEVANRELEGFAYSVSHDLRAPLRHLSGFTRILLEDHLSELSETPRSYLDRIAAASAQMSLLIDCLLNLSRVATLEVNCGPVNLSDLAERLAGELRHEHPQRDVRFHGTPGISARGDPILLRQLLYNLLANAWKFTRNRPTAHVEFGVEMGPCPGASENDEPPVYFVRDDGVGFDMAHAADDLFRPFHRFHRAEDFEGTGVGLAIAQRIVRRHFGRIWAESSPDHGATFYFTLTL